MIDSSIYFQQQNPDLVGSIAKGLQMREALDQRNAKQDFRDEWAKGNLSVDNNLHMGQKKTLSALAAIDPMKAMQAQSQMVEQNYLEEERERKAQLQKIDLSSRILGTVKDQESWEAALNTASQMGLDMSKEPKAYDPNYVKSIWARSLSRKEQLELQNKDRSYQLDRDRFKSDQDYKGKMLELQKERINKARGFGKAPGGYRFKTDGSLEPIPGGPAFGKKERQDLQRKQGANLVVQDIGRSLNYLKNSSMAAGPYAGQTAMIPGTPADTLEKMLESIKANVGFDKLQAMREASPTGGALGSVSEKENAMLQATVGNLRVDQPKELLDANLKRLYNQYNDVIHGKGKGPERYKLPFDERGNPIDPNIGRIVIVKGKRYKVDSDGDTLVPIEE